MSDVERAQLKIALSKHYESQREHVAPEVLDNLAAAMVAESKQAALRASNPAQLRMSMPAFLAAQVRYIPAWTWAAQVVLIVLVGMMAASVSSIASGAAALKLAIGAFAAASVLVGVPSVQSSKLHHVVELEYACAHNAASVVVARLIVLGCSSSLAVAAMVAVAAHSLNASAFDVALWAYLPFFVTCAGSLFILRKANPQVAIVLCLVWAISCSAVLFVLARMFPAMYTHATQLVWLGVSALALGWLVREVACTLRAVASGLDAFSPAMATIST